MRKALKQKLAQRQEVEVSPSTWRRTTKIILVAVAAALFLYDLLPFVDPVRHDTLSEVISEYSLRSFTIPMFFGALCGHFFFLRDGTKPNLWASLTTLSVFVGLDIVAYRFDCVFLQSLQRCPEAWFVIGVPLGMLFWPQTRSDKL